MQTCRSPRLSDLNIITVVYSRPGGFYFSESGRSSPIPLPPPSPPSLLPHPNGCTPRSSPRLQREQPNFYLGLTPSNARPWERLDRNNRPIVHRFLVFGGARPSCSSPLSGESQIRTEMSFISLHAYRYGSRYGQQFLRMQSYSDALIKAALKRDAGSAAPTSVCRTALSPA